MLYKDKNPLQRHKNPLWHRRSVYSHHAPTKQKKWPRYSRALRRMTMVQPECLDEENGEWKTIQNIFRPYLKE
jgi:hypothetical protein